ncbi:8-oxo-dGDP phosphatase NUDT18-like isoform X2 [Ornithodoros turicata]|uniref:8-oxo-dGDP phosphatase NUDT18-like isoform X2 n=1 Tax=Ornithodoros turicata TaxID=34597 RepID=UPI0031386784
MQMSLAAKGVESSVMPDYKPIVKKSVTYIVAAVAVNEKGEVLMMQEAKSSCAGTWYLPAGRMELGENILDAVKREVNEETGLDFEPTSLLMVESAQGQWYRFVFVGNILGGELKTVARADSESLQASWIDDISQLSLRCKDILPVIERARLYHQTQHSEPWHPPTLPVIRPHEKLYLRIVTIIRKKANNMLHVLVSEKGNAHLPMCEINPARSVHTALKKFVHSIFSSEPPPHKPHGVLSLEHSGAPVGEHDGLCLALLVSCKAALEDISLSPGYTWLEVSTPLSNKLLARTNKNMTVFLKVQ